MRGDNKEGADNYFPHWRTTQVASCHDASAPYAAMMKISINA